MHELAQQIIQDLPDSVYETVARSVLGDLSAVIVGSPDWSEISAAHNDLRTVAILRVEGKAKTAAGVLVWSSVQKLIDTSADAGPAAIGDWIDPEREEAVYENRLFGDGGLRMRPAKCHLVYRPKPNLKMLWLEDLTSAQGTPFSLPQLSKLVRDIGQFNGHHAVSVFDLPFRPAEYSYLVRWQGFRYNERLTKVVELADEPEVQRAYGDIAIESAIELQNLIEQLLNRNRDLPTSLSFGDCNPGNLFLVGDETVAIDWARMTMDPIGVDAGCLVGASMIWGRRGAEVAEAERDLFSDYIGGLSATDWIGNSTDIRRAYFGQFGGYLLAAGTGPTFLIGPPEYVDHMRQFVEKRFQTPFEDIPELLAPIVAKYPDYIAEVSKLLE